MMEKILNGIGKYISSFEMWVWLVTVSARKYQPFWVSVSISDLNQNSGFSLTLICNSMGLILLIVEPVDTSNSQNWDWSGVRNYRFETT